MMSDDTGQTLFTEPTLDQVTHWLRELDYDQRFVGHSMTPSAGNSAKDMYSMRDMAIFVLGTRWDAPMLSDGFKGALNWMDVGKLVIWLRDVVGDVELAEAIERDLAGLDVYRDQNLAIASLVRQRMVQYDEVYRAATAAEDADHEAADAAVE
jgi:hypothetical protein